MWRGACYRGEGWPWWRLTPLFKRSSSSLLIFSFFWFPFTHTCLPLPHSVAPNHPGALHYRIHNLDDPFNGTSARALDAAAKYGLSSPDSPHAQHMPCHTYIRNGMWRAAMSANELSLNAGDKWMAHRGSSMTHKDFHSIEYQQYVYVQQGRFQSAMQFVDFYFVVAFDLDSFARYVGGILMEARQLAEALAWTIDETFVIPLEFTERLTCPTCEDPSFMDGMYLITAHANAASYFARVTFYFFFFLFCIFFWPFLLTIDFIDRVSWLQRKRTSIKHIWRFTSSKTKPS